MGGGAGFFGNVLDSPGTSVYTAPMNTTTPEFDGDEFPGGDEMPPREYANDWEDWFAENQEPLEDW
jgi:hypothetical protein